MGPALALAIMFIVLVRGAKRIRGTSIDRITPTTMGVWILATMIGTAVLVLLFLMLWNMMPPAIGARHRLGVASIFFGYAVLWIIGMHAWRRQKAKGPLLRASLLGACSLTPILAYYVLRGTVSPDVSAILMVVLLLLSGAILSISSIRRR
jgi:hypothetical protein